MSVPAVVAERADGPVAALRLRFGAPAAWAIAAGTLAWAACIPVLRAVLTDADRGLDLMDESHYLMAAQPWAASKAFNGLFGWYSGRLLGWVGQDLARFRLLGAILLIGAALVLARAVRLGGEHLAGAPWPPWLRALWPPASVSAALCYYTVFVRTPSYNWFASLGLMLLAAGLVRIVATSSDGPTAVITSGALFAAGAFGTAIGKVTTALGATAVALLVVAVHAATSSRRCRARLARAFGAAVVTGAGLVGGHLALVNGVTTTAATYRRVSGMMSTVDPDHYAPGAAIGSAVAGLHNVLLDRPWDYLPLLVLPVLMVGVPWLEARRPGWWLAGAQLVAVAVPTARVLHDYPGGVPGLGMSIPPSVIAAEVGVVVAVIAASWWRVAPVGARPPTAGLLAAALLAMGVCYPLGTNVEYATQLHGGFVILLAAAALGVCCIPDGGRLACLGGLAVGAVVLAAVLVPTTRATAPYRIAPLDQQVLARSIVPGTPAVLVDADTAAWIDGLREAARGGFGPGTPMLDLTWHPASVLVLDGRAPSVLLPNFPGLASAGASAAFAVAQEDRTRWRGAWLLVPLGQDDAIADEATSVLGLDFPADYEQVATVVAPYDRQQQGLWRPREGASPTLGG